MDGDNGTDATTQQPSSADSQRRAWLLVAGATVLAVVFFSLWLTARQDANQAQRELDRLQQAQAEEQARAAALPNLEALAEEHLSAGVVEFSSEESLSLNFYRDTQPLAALLEELEFSPAVMNRIGNTRALDGTLTAEAPHASASWTYHPDDGLSIVIERTR